MPTFPADMLDLEQLTLPEQWTHFKPSSLQEIVTIGCVRDRASGWDTIYLLACHSLSEIFAGKMSSFIAGDSSKVGNIILLNILSVLVLSWVISGSRQTLLCYSCAY